MGKLFELLLLVILLTAASASATTPPGTRIEGRASADYIDTGSGLSARLDSNLVLAIVQQVSAFTLSATQSRVVTPGGTVYFPHLLVNTGNGAENFTLSAADVYAGTFAVAGITLYADTNADGAPDSFSPINSTGLLAAGSSFGFLATVQVPSGALGGQSDQIAVTAAGTATATPAPAQTNTDTLSLSYRAVVAVTKSFSLTYGPTPNNNGGAHIAVTLTFTNTGNEAANVSFNDVIGAANSVPGYNTSGLSYVAGSGRWNGAQVLSDIAAGDPSGISFAATTVGGVTTIDGTISVLRANSATTVSFLVDVLADLPAGSSKTFNTVPVTYWDGAAQQSTLSNTAAYEVQLASPAPDLVLSKSHSGVFTVGFDGAFTFIVKNTGTTATQGNITVTDVLNPGFNFVAATSGGAGWTCSAVGQTVACSNPVNILPGSQLPPLSIMVKPNAAAQAASPITNAAIVGGGGEPARNTGNNTATDTVTIQSAASLSGRVWEDGNHNSSYDTGEKLVEGWMVELLDMSGNVIETAYSGSNGNYAFDSLLPGNYKVRFREATAGNPIYGTPVDETGSQTGVNGYEIINGIINKITLNPGSNISGQSLPLDPSGTVYDAVTRTAIAGAKVKISGPGGSDPSACLIGGSANVEQITGADGRYQFLLMAGCTGLYSLSVTAPATHIAPSGLIAAETAVYEPTTVAGGMGVGVNPIQAQNGPPPAGSPTTYYMKFNMVTGMKDVVSNHIPLDPVVTSGSGLLIQKTAARSTVEIGDFLDYTIVVKNANAAGGGVFPAVQVSDTLPRGFTYQRGSARLNGAVLADPAGKGGPTITFSGGALAALAADSSLSLTYRVLVGAGATLGNGINTAQAVSGTTKSNVAAVAVKIIQGIFSDSAYLIGTVYMDCSRDHIVDDGKESLAWMGIPGVRLYLEDGTSVVTDSEGKYSLYGLMPRNHVIKVDKTTMPVGAELMPIANRQAGVAESRFADLKKGELHRADFASGTCSENVMRQVELRRRIHNGEASEFDHAMKYKLDSQAVRPSVADPRALPASGQLGAASVTPERFEAVLSNTKLDASNSNLPAQVAPQQPPISLEKLLPLMADNSVGFVELKDQDVLPMTQTQVRVKGPLGSVFKLRVNGREVGADRVGMKSSLVSKELEAWEYIGVAMQPGENALELVQLDQFGNERGKKSIVLIAPDQMAKIVIDAPASAAADGKTPLAIKVRLLDAQGIAVTARTAITLEAGLGVWQVTDLDKKERGVQVFLIGGEAEYKLLSATQVGDDELRVSSGLIQAQHRLSFVPELRPLVAAGIIEGAINLRSLNVKDLAPITAHDSFDKEIQQFAYGSGGKAEGAARAALFVKGKVKGEYLLTLGYDSDKDTKERLFRDIQPDEFYPVYGDSAEKSFDAQSTGRLYVRVDKGRSFLLYGDYTSQSQAPARVLSQYNRSLTGIKEHYETANTMVNAFASQDTTRQVVQEIATDGTSGPYQLNNKGALINSEKIELLTRDRNQPTIVLKTEVLTRFVDYEIEQYTGRILFKAPLASLDSNLNPMSIRVTYELDQGGTAFWITGADVQHKLSERFEIGGAWVHDNNPLATTLLTSANATVKLAEKTVLVGELAQSDTGASGVGNARRIELRQGGDKFQGRLYSGSADDSYDNASSALLKGNTESGGKVSYKLSDRTSLGAEAIRSNNSVSGAWNNGVLLRAEQVLAENLRLEGGVRDSSSGNPATNGTHTTTARTKLTAQSFLGLKALSVNGEYEQDVRASANKVVAAGADYQFAQRGRLYARHEFISSLTSAFALDTAQRSNSTVVGLDSDYSKDTHVFSEYRARSAIDGREAEAAMGLRNKWDLAEGLRAHTSAERIQRLTGGSGRNTQAYTGALEYTADPLWKAATRLEYRNSDSSSGWLNSVDGARKLNESWTALGKHVYSLTSNKGAASGERILHRIQGGLAWRELTEHKWNALGKYEHRREQDSTSGLAIDRSLELASMHVNYQHGRGWQYSGHYAGKWITDGSSSLAGNSNAHLFSARATKDLTERWDVGVITSMLTSNGGRSVRSGLGMEAGYLWQENLWVSAGVNIFGFSDKDMLTPDITDKGVYIRLRFKFDEDVFSGPPQQ